MDNTIKSLINPTNLPCHVGIIMDGNGRWATQQGKKRLYGHQNSLQSIRDAVEGCAELGIRYLTVYAFSTENWDRPQEEVAGILDLIATHVEEELAVFMENNIKLMVIGELEKLPLHCQDILHKVTEATKQNHGLHLTIALNYGGRSEIIAATKAIVRDVQAGVITHQAITHDLFEQYLYTKGLPDLSLLIRTSGEMRLSNFLTWQVVYTELYFIQELWPDFRKKHLYDAVIAYQKRKRRFGSIN